MSSARPQKPPPETANSPVERTRAVSAQAWAAAGLLSLLMLAGVPWAIDAARTWSPSGSQWLALLNDSDDHRAAAGVEVLSGQTAAADLVILGDSTIEHAFWNDAEMDAALGRARSGLTVSKLATPAQTPVDSLFLMSQVESHPGQLVVVSFRYSALRRDEPFLIIDNAGYLSTAAVSNSPLLRERHAARPWWERLATQRALWHQRLTRQLGLPLQRWAQRVLYPPRPGTTAPVPPASKAQGPSSDGMQRLDRNFDANLDLAERAFDELFGRLKGQGAQLLWLEPPKLGDSYAGAHPDKRARFEAMLGRLQGRHGLQRLDLNPLIHWADGDLADPRHLGPQGRAKWSQAFIDWVREHSGPPPPP